MAEVGQAVRLSGWCHRIRDHGGVLFIDLRDHYGMTQCVVDPDSPAFAQAEKLRSELVVRIDGARAQAPARAPKTPKWRPGSIEVYVREIEVLGPAGDLPLPVFGDQPYPEDTRLRYRFLDLRREKLHQQHHAARAQSSKSFAQRMKGQGFFEFQTPILTASSPEGARDFLVPSRIHPGKFYALPQAPQQYKQLLMMAGFDRYFQIAPCFRDEDPRADRLPGEFYQLDIEMSFVEQDDVFAAMEPVMRGVFEEFGERQAGDAVAVAAHSLRRGDAEIRLRQAGSAQSDRDAGRLRAFPRFGLQGVRTAAGASQERVWAIPAPGGGQRTFCRPDERLGAGRGPAGARLHPVLDGAKDETAHSRRPERDGRRRRGPLANNIGPSGPRRSARSSG